MWTSLVVLVQPLLGESFGLRQCQKTPAVQESCSEDAVEALDKWNLPRAYRINIVGANRMLQEPFLHLASHNLTTVVTAQAIRCSPNAGQRLQRPDDVKSTQRTPAGQQYFSSLRDHPNVGYIISLLRNMLSAEPTERERLRRVIRNMLDTETQLRSKKRAD